MDRASNACWEGSVMVEKVNEMKQDMGLNALSEKYEDMIKTWILRKQAPSSFESSSAAIYTLRGWPGRVKGLKNACSAYAAEKQILIFQGH